MKSRIFGISSVSRVLVVINQVILMIALSVLVLSVVLQVFLRVFFKTSFVPLSDIISYSFPIATFVGASLLFKEANGHICITFFTDLIGEKFKKILMVVAESLIFIVLFYILIWGWQFALNGRYQFSPTLKINMVYIFLVVPFFGLSSLIFKIESLLQRREKNSIK